MKIYVAYECVNCGAWGHRPLTVEDRGVCPKTGGAHTSEKVELVPKIEVTYTAPSVTSVTSGHEGILPGGGPVPW